MGITCKSVEKANTGLRFRLAKQCATEIQIIYKHYLDFIIIISLSIRVQNQGEVRHTSSDKIHKVMVENIMFHQYFSYLISESNPCLTLKRYFYNQASNNI